MIDLRRLRDDAAYRDGAARKGASPEFIDEVLAADEAWRAVTHQAEQARAAQNAASREIGRASPDERPAKIAEAARLKEDVERLEVSERETAERRTELALQVPNPAAVDVPSGGEEHFETVHEVGERGQPPAHDHAEIGALAGLVDSESGARNSGSRFAYLKGPAVRLEFALVQWTMDLLERNGFVPVVPPVLVRAEMMVEAGFFPADRHQVYEIDGDDLFLIGTSEVALAGLHRGERLDRAELPLRYAGFSSCFRREAGTYGKDTRGIFRVHQFDKVEMFSFCDSETSWDELESLRAIQEEIVSSLDLPYRVINVAAGDLGAAAAKKYDLEVWLPSERAYREITSCSNYTDYSARRLGTRWFDDDGHGLVHTLNGTACAVGRALVFIMENHQRPDGSIAVPEVLHPWLNFTEIPAPA
ncbi:serine--tRNA ligase [Candidatus Poriferisodalis multihospitum]|uniref:serine--tRNA ligase n=1 Tax=Candidatus Poriferisodalis multihospitum TaxID=2983191 RepID=UPI002B25A654|nr:serine--tRNA ligase [Candidatus Poriferisodalis multihospitum]